MRPDTRPRIRNSGRQHEGKRAPAYLQWLRGRPCAVANDDCDGRMEAAHVRIGTGGGMGVKPSDWFCLPMCEYHHSQQHRVGEASFARMHGIKSMVDLALSYWAAWAGKFKWDQANG